MPRSRRRRTSPISPLASHLQIAAPPPPQFASPQPHRQENPPFPSFHKPPPAQFQSPRTTEFGQPHQQTPFHPQEPPLRQSLIYTKEKVPAEPSTKWEDLDPDSQNFLFKIEEQILEHKAASLRLDHCSRLYEPSVSSYSAQLDANQITQELGEIGTIMEREKVSAQELLNDVGRISWNTQLAVHSYIVLSSNLTTVPANQAVRAMGISNSNNQQMNSYLVPIHAFYIGNYLTRPSAFMRLTVARFEKHLSECCGWINELEQLILKDTGRPSSKSIAAMLSNIMSCWYHYFVRVAAKVEKLHQYVHPMKAAYLADQWRRGDENDPFLEADRREAAKQEASAWRLHPSMHGTSVSQPSTQSTVLFTSSGLPVSSDPQPSSVFRTPSASPASTTSHLRTPSASAPTLNLFR